MSRTIINMGSLSLAANRRMDQSLTVPHQRSPSTDTSSSIKFIWSQFIPLIPIVPHRSSGSRILLILDGWRATVWSSILSREPQLPRRKISILRADLVIGEVLGVASISLSCQRGIQWISSTGTITTACWYSAQVTPLRIIFEICNAPFLSTFGRRYNRL